MEGRSLSDFIRSAALKRASEVFDREKARRMAEQKRRENHRHTSANPPPHTQNGIHEAADTNNILSTSEMQRTPRYTQKTGKS